MQRQAGRRAYRWTRTARVTTVAGVLALLMLPGCKERAAIAAEEAMGTVDGALVVVEIANTLQDDLDVEVVYLQRRVQAFHDSEGNIKVIQSDGSHALVVDDTVPVYTGTLGKKGLTLAFPVVRGMTETPHRYSSKQGVTWFYHLIEDCVEVRKLSKDGAPHVYARTPLNVMPVTFRDGVHPLAEETGQGRWLVKQCKRRRDDAKVKLTMEKAKKLGAMLRGSETKLSQVWNGSGTSTWTGNRLVVLQTSTQPSASARIEEQLCKDGGMSWAVNRYHVCEPKEAYAATLTIPFVNKDKFLIAQLTRDSIHAPFRWHAAQWETIEERSGLGSAPELLEGAEFHSNGVRVEARTRDGETQLHLPPSSETIGITAKQGKESALSLFQPRINRHGEEGLRLELARPEIRFYDDGRMNECQTEVLNIETIREVFGKSLWEEAMTRTAWTGRESPRLRVKPDYAKESRVRVKIRESAPDAFTVEAGDIEWTDFELKLPNGYEGGWSVRLGETQGNGSLVLSRTNRVNACELGKFLGSAGTNPVRMTVTPPEQHELYGFVSAEVEIDRGRLRTGGDLYRIEVDERDFEWSALNITSEAIRNFAPSVIIVTRNGRQRVVKAEPESGEQGTRVELRDVVRVTQSLALARPISKRVDFVRFGRALTIKDEVDRCVKLREVFEIPDGTKSESVAIYTGGRTPILAYEDGTVPQREKNRDSASFETVWLETGKGLLRDGAGTPMSHRLACTLPRRADDLAVFIFLRERHDTDESRRFTRAWMKESLTLAKRLKEIGFNGIEWVYPHKERAWQQEFEFKKGKVHQVWLNQSVNDYFADLRAAGTTNLPEGDGDEPRGKEALEAVRQFRKKLGERKILAFVPEGTTPACADPGTPECEDLDTVWWEGPLETTRIGDLKW